MARRAPDGSMIVMRTILSKTDGGEMSPTGGATTAAEEPPMVRLIGIGSRPVEEEEVLPRCAASRRRIHRDNIMVVSKILRITDGGFVGPFGGFPWRVTTLRSQRRGAETEVEHMAIDVPPSLIEDSNSIREDNVICAVVNDVYGSSSSAWSIIAGLFVFYILHDALQERMFQFDGYEYGFFMTLAEVSVMLILSVVSDENGSRSDLVNATIRRRTSSRQTKKKTKNKQLTDDEQGKNKIHNNHQLSFSTIVRISQVGILLALSHGLGNTSLKYSPYPLKVAFKSCKLVPTMILSACVTERYHTSRQYVAALVMGLGLAVLTAADVTTTEFHTGDVHHVVVVPVGSSIFGLGAYIGPILLGISVIFDSIIPNLQEQYYK